MKKALATILSFISTIVVLLLKFGGVALHLYTVLIILGMHGFLFALLAFCLPVASQIYCFIASIMVSGYFLNTYSILILIYLAVWVVLLIIGSVTSRDE